MSFQESFFVTVYSLEEQVPQKVAEKDFEQEVAEISESRSSRYSIGAVKNPRAW
jgi:hypothetical protein